MSRTKSKAFNRAKGLANGRNAANDGAKIDALGTASTHDVGTSAGNMIVLDSSGRLPAIDGSLLTGIEGVPQGIISMWSGLASDIPSGWYLCDGTNGTPNLVGKFIKAGSAAGGTGGSNTHSHSHSLSAGAHTLSTAQMPSHRHGAYMTQPSYNYVIHSFGGGYPHTRPTQYTHYAGSSHSHSHSLSGSIASASNEPAYYELCYIMKG